MTSSWEICHIWHQTRLWPPMTPRRVAMGLLWPQVNVDTVPPECKNLHNWIECNSPLPSSNKWWRHQMEIFSAVLALCEGNHRWPVNSSHKGQWRRALMISLSCALTNGWTNNRDAGDLRRQCTHYDVIVMRTYFDIKLRQFVLRTTLHNNSALVHNTPYRCVGKIRLGTPINIFYDSMNKKNKLCWSTRIYFVILKRHVAISLRNGYNTQSFCTRYNYCRSEGVELHNSFKSCRSGISLSKYKWVGEYFSGTSGIGRCVTQGEICH